MSRAGQITGVSPAAGIAGGEVVIDCVGFDNSEPTVCSVLFNNESAPLTALSSRRALAIVPELKQAGPIEISLECENERSSPATFTMGSRLAEDLHPVANPAYDPDDGALFVTRSGSRGERLPITLFRINADGSISEYSGDIANPTAIAFDGEGQMFVSSRFDGVVYRVTAFREALPFARNLGIATGMAFDREGTLYVGDRSGTIYRVNPVGEERAWVQLEPSVSAYHLAFGPDDALYVTGPTVSSFDSIHRIDRDGEMTSFFKGLGRPQGLAFDKAGSLYVVASYKGRRGVVRLAEGKEPELIVAGMNLVGLAFGPTGEMAVASNEAVHSLPLGIQGALL